MRRFSIRAVMAVIVLAAIGLAAVRNCSPVWSGAMLSITFFTLTCSILGIAFRRKRRRIYWIGFATLGWVYLLLSFHPSLHSYVGQSFLGPQFLASLEQLLHAEVPAGGLQSVPVEMFGVAATGGGFGGGAGPGPTLINPYPCIQIGVALEAMIWAALGGYAATFLLPTEMKTIPMAALLSEGQFLCGDRTRDATALRTSADEVGEGPKESALSPEPATTLRCCASSKATALPLPETEEGLQLPVR
jgi:hypothetical protein